MKKTCSGCGYFVLTNYFFGECHWGAKIDYKWVKNYCDKYKAKVFKQREPEGVVVESLSSSSGLKVGRARA